MKRMCSVRYLLLSLHSTFRVSGGAIPASVYRLSVFVDFRLAVISGGRCHSASGSVSFRGLNVPMQGMRSLQLSTAYH